METPELDEALLAVIGDILNHRIKPSQALEEIKQIYAFHRKN